MEVKTFAYIRVSSRDQNVARQIEALQQYVQSERDIFIDKQSGKNFVCDAYQAMKLHLRKGDVVYVKSLDRFGRNKDQIKTELEWFKKNGVLLRILDVPTTMIDFSDFGALQQAVFEMVNNILIEVLGTFAEQERRMIKEHQREGIDIALKEGIKFGRPQIPFPDNWETLYNRWKSKEIEAVQIMRETNIKPASFYNLVKRYELSQKELS